MKNYKVYCHLFPNGKRYIGITGSSLAKRFQNGKGYYQCPYMSKAIEKYGWENIQHIILEENLTKEEAEQKEIYYIAFYDTTNHEKGYNLALGGNVASHYDYNKILQDWNEGLCVGEIAKKYNCKHQEVIGRILETLGIPKEERYKRGYEKRTERFAQKIAQYDLEGNLIKIYKNVSECEKETGYRGDGFSKVCRGVRKTAYGFIWKYIENK